MSKDIDEVLRKVVVPYRREEAKKAIEALLDKKVLEARTKDLEISRDRFKPGWEKDWFEERIKELSKEKNLEKLDLPAEIKAGETYYTDGNDVFKEKEEV